MIYTLAHKRAHPLEKLPFLEKYGFSLRPFGGKSYACEAIPSHIEQEEAKGVIEELLMGRLPMRSLKKRRFTLEEAKRLAEELFAKGLEKEATNFLSEEELGKRFKS
jgi:DNA mismatch repair ATPase MutL